MTVFPVDFDAPPMSTTTNQTRTKRIGCIALSANKKFLAVSEQLETSTQISIINMTTLKKVTTLKYSDVKEIKELCFDKDGRALVGMCYLLL